MLPWPFSRLFVPASGAVASSPSPRRGLYPRPTRTGIGEITVVGGPGVAAWGAYRIEGARNPTEWFAGVDWLLSQLHGDVRGTRCIGGWYFDPADGRIEFMEASADASPRQYAHVFVRVPLLEPQLGPGERAPATLIDVTGLQGIAWPSGQSLPFVARIGTTPPSGALCRPPPAW